jgi:hypothetical protein
MTNTNTNTNTGTDTSALALVQKIVKYNTTAYSDDRWIYQQDLFCALFSQLIDAGVLRVELALDQDVWAEIYPQLTDEEQRQMDDALEDFADDHVAEIVEPWASREVQNIRLERVDTDMAMAHLQSLIKKQKAAQPDEAAAA